LYPLDAFLVKKLQETHRAKRSDERWRGSIPSVHTAKIGFVAGDLDTTPVVGAGVLASGASDHKWFSGLQSIHLSL